MPFPWNPGMVVNADRLNQHLPRWVMKSATEARTSTATPAADAELRLTLDPGTWDVRIWVSYTAASGATGVRVNWGLAAGMSLTGFRMCQGPTTNSTDRNSTLAKFVNTTANAEVSYGGTSAFAIFEEWGAVTVSSAGTFALQWAQSTSNAAAVQVGQGSYMRADRIA